jgi:UDP-N-acetylglucosamine 4,6-dehydratase
MTALLNYKSVLVTGGTGSFGKAFIKIILQRYPNLEKVIVLSRDEFKQFEMSKMPEFEDNPKLRFFVGDVRDKDRLMRAFDGVDVVVHAAALKQVPSCEYNPFEAVKTNILGAQNVIDAAIDRNVKKVIALSTDKACAPINLYGATKLCSDKLFIAGNSYAGFHDTRFAVVRYGNVAGSRGSVIPYFRRLLDNGAKELPITDFRMTRFWLKLEQAVEMVLLALDAMKGGELFVKKIPSMKIIDLAQAIAPGVKMFEVGIRPGEKIHEMMISQEDALHTHEFDGYYVIEPAIKFWDKVDLTAGGKLVASDFEYHSGNNKEWLTIEQMQNMISELCAEHGKEVSMYESSKNIHIRKTVNFLA